MCMLVSSGWCSQAIEGPFPPLVWGGAGRTVAPTAPVGPLQSVIFGSSQELPWSFACFFVLQIFSFQIHQANLLFGNLLLPLNAVG